MNRLHDETVKCRVVLYELNVKFVYILIGRVLVFAREPDGGGWAPGDGTYKYTVERRFGFQLISFSRLSNSTVAAHLAVG